MDISDCELGSGPRDDSARDLEKRDKNELIGGTRDAGDREKSDTCQQIGGTFKFIAGPTLTILIFLGGIAPRGHVLLHGVEVPGLLLALLFDVVVVVLLLLVAVLLALVVVLLVDEVGRRRRGRRLASEGWRGRGLGLDVLEEAPSNSICKVKNVT